MSSTDNVVLCMKWGTKYGPEYVNHLYAMVKKNLSLPFRFVCLTDDAAGLREEVETYPIPSLDLPEGIPERGWKKLAVFREDLYGLQGNALFLDVDIVIIGSLDAFFEQPGDFLVIHDWKRPWRITGNSSVFRFRLGAYPEILKKFIRTQAEVRQNFRNEQAYLSKEMHDRGVLKYWPKEWCQSFKYHCLRRFPLNFFLEPRIPENSKVLVFHGETNPHDAMVGRSNRALRYMRPASWIKDYWH